MKASLILAFMVFGIVGCSSFKHDENMNEASREVAAERSIKIDLSETTTKSAGLGVCGADGNAYLERIGGTLRLVINDASNCSNVYVQEQDGDLVKIGKFKGGQGKEVLSLNERKGHNLFRIKLESGSKKTWADISVKSYVPQPQPKKVFNKYTPVDFTLSNYLFGRKFAMLPDCGGSVSLSVSDGEVVLNFESIEKCTNFDIIGVNGQSTEYKEQKIGGGNGPRSESIRLPRHFYDWATNGIKVVVKSNAAKTFDVFKIEFFSF